MGEFLSEYWLVIILGFLFLVVAYNNLKNYVGAVVLLTPLIALFFYAVLDFTVVGSLIAGLICSIFCNSASSSSSSNIRLESTDWFSYKIGNIKKNFTDYKFTKKK